MARPTEQAVWNAIATQLRDLADAETCLSTPAIETNGIAEYFEWWSALFPSSQEREGEFALHPNGVMTLDERSVLQRLVDVLNLAWADAENLSAAEYLKTPWPRRISQLAIRAADLMEQRGGLFSESVAEAEPSKQFQAN